MTTNELNGGCACGKIRYTCRGEIGFSFHCQCRDCQHASGTGHSSAFIVRDDETGTVGNLNWYERKTPTGNIVRQGFCGTCGSPIMNRNSGYPENLFITAGSLDDPSIFNPVKIVHRDSQCTWDFADPETV